MATRQARAVADATRLRLLTLLGLASSIGILALVGRRMRDAEGLVHVLHYLDSARARL